jgi:hypothetical protein
MVMMRHCRQFASHYRIHSAISVGDTYIYCTRKKIVVYIIPYIVEKK